MTKPFFAPQSASESSRGQGPQGDDSAAMSPSRGGRLLLDAQRARGLVHRLALIDAEAQHRLAQHRSHFNPNQPRVPAGNPDGGQWTRTGASRIGPQLAGGGKPPLGLYQLLFAIAAQAAKLLIEDYRSKNRTDLFGHEPGAVVVTVVDGDPIFGPSSKAGEYKSEDRHAAEKLRADLVKKYPAVFDRSNLGQKPNDALFHGETTALLRAAKKRGGTLAGQTLTVFTDRELCNNCERVLPYVGLELGNPTVTFVDPDGSIMTMRDGAWIVGRTK
jgi:hypothetical protein